MKNHGADGKVSGAEPHIAVGTKRQPRANAVTTAEAIDHKKGGLQAPLTCPGQVAAAAV